MLLLIVLVLIMILVIEALTLLILVIGICGLRMAVAIIIMATLWMGRHDYGYLNQSTILQSVSIAVCVGAR